MTSNLRISLRRSVAGIVVVVTAAATGACGWRGPNSVPLPGTEGGGAGSFTVRAQLPDVAYIQPNSRVRVGDVTVGNVTKIEREGWHALITMKINSDVDLPENATAKLGQTSLLGSLHVELAPPADTAPEGKLHNGSLIPLAAGSTYPTTEQTLAALSMLLNGGGVGQVQDITRALSTAFGGREQDLRSLLAQIDQFAGHLNDQRDDIIAATDSLNRLAGQFNDQKPVLDKALRTIPDALAVLSSERDKLTEALAQIGKFSALAADSVHQTKAALVDELNDVAPVLDSLANSGPALTRSLSSLGFLPWSKETITNWVRGDYANLTAIVDLTLSRIDASLFTGTRWEGNLTELEMQWGRTIGQLPSPYTAGNPLVAPYHQDQGR
jgi:phospholipid/cholesterol/gamma-HCH transport system substrate-binding protein